jgi:hypothetical protein
MTRHATGKAPASASTPVDSSSSRDISSITAETTQHSGDEQTSEPVFAGEAVRQIEALVETFRTGKAKKSQTIFKIGQILASEPSGSERGYTKCDTVTLAPCLHTHTQPVTVTLT